MAAVRQNGFALIWASERLRGNSKIVMAAVGQCKYSIKYASKSAVNKLKLWESAARLSATCRDMLKVYERMIDKDVDSLIVTLAAGQRQTLSGLTQTLLGHRK